MAHVWIYASRHTGLHDRAIGRLADTFVILLAPAYDLSVGYQRYMRYHDGERLLDWSEG